MITIHSFRPGTGKSHLVANMAVVMAGQGRRCVVIDSAIYSPPSLHLLFNLNENDIHFALNDYMAGKCTLQQATYDVTPFLQKKVKGQIFLVPSNAGIHLVGIEGRSGFSIERFSDGICELSEALKVDMFIVDNHAIGFNEKMLVSLAITDILVILLCPDQQDYQGTSVIVDVARKLEVPRIFLAVNKVLPSFDLEAVRQQVEQTYVVPVCGVLPYSEDLARLSSSSIFYLRYPRHPFSRRLQEMVTKITC